MTVDTAITPEVWVGLLGVIVGALVSVVASVIVPWIRDSLDRRRREKEQRAEERQRWLMSALAALLEYRQAHGTTGGNAGVFAAKFGTASNELTVRLTREEQPVLDVLYMMFVMIQRPRAGIEDMVGEASNVLVLWARGDIPIGEVIAHVERRAKVKFSEDRTKVSPLPRPTAGDSAS